MYYCPENYAYEISPWQYTQLKSILTKQFRPDVLGTSEIPGILGVLRDTMFKVKLTIHFIRSILKCKHYIIALWSRFHMLKNC